jgi:hypothetical protein
MNSANLQLQGLLTVIAELFAMLQARGVLSADDIAVLLAHAERSAGTDAESRPGVSAVELETVLFPIRLLMEANRAGRRDERLGFSELARLVGENKPPRPGVETPEESFALAMESERERDA